MNARRPRGARRRRGVVLILILAMLGLLALIGVTFATFSGQAKTGAEYTAQGLAQPPADQFIDFAIDQLINDSSNPKSAIRGHSLLRDMYGRDFFSDPVSGRVLPYQNRHVTGLLGTPLWFTQVAVNYDTNDSAKQHPIYVVQTNIPTSSNPLIQKVPDLAGANFTGNLLRLQQWLVDATNGRYTPLRQLQDPDRLAQTFEIVADNYNNSTGYHVFTLSYADQATTATTLTPVASPPSAFVQPVATSPPNGGTFTANIFEIDGRYMRAFNGTGMGTSVAVDDYGVNRPYSAFPNFLYNRLNNVNYPSGLNDPNLPASSLSNIPAQLDEDYDAPDNENWFLALRSADGQFLLPSFHRPGNIIYNPNNLSAENDWQNNSASARSKFLRPRKIDNPLSGDTFRDLIPDAATGKIVYDVDNDGDGVSDSVWVDLGYPVQRDPTGKKYKPLFAFLVLGLNGRIPLNTAGNLNGRAVDGTPTFNHVSHIGYSVNEINPEYALTPGYPVYSGPDPMDNTVPLYRAAIAPADGKGNLQMLAQGNPGYRAGTTNIPPTEGRWGEVDVMLASNFTLFPRAGRSYAPSGASLDLLDSDFNAFDFYPARNTTTTPPITPEDRDMLDPSNRTLLPVERMRRFVTPVDLSGNGRVMPFDEVPFGPSDWGLGFDLRGRVGYFLHYRPPGVSNWDADWFSGTTSPARLADISKNVLNKLHGYESYRNPLGNARNLMAMMPWDTAPPAPMTPTNGLKAPTFSNSINSAPIAPFAGTLPTVDASGNPAPATLALGDPTQMNLYTRTAEDAPFGLAEQEWLDRKGDIDGPALKSRLDTLVDLSNLRNAGMPAAQFNAFGTYKNAFTTDPNASKTRNLFVTETWDLNVAVAPVNSMGVNFGAASTSAVLSDGSRRRQFSDDFDLVANKPINPTDVSQLPSLVHGGKRFNLNLPLPPSDLSTEPVRQKYVRELYTLLKSVVYPPDGAMPATDTPEQKGARLAALGQFAVNAVDFRDPDATMTKFVNYDITYTGPDINTVVADPNGGTAVSTITQPARVTLATGANNTAPVIQWGMEYNPIAITEVLAYQFTRYDAALKADKTTPRLFIELVNTLTSDYYDGSGRGTNCDQDLRGWGLIITQDNPSTPAVGGVPLAQVERPNIITGQLSQSTIDSYFVPIQGSGIGSSTATYTAAGTITKKVQALMAGTGSPNYFVLANAVGGTINPPATVETGTPPVDLQIDDNLVNQIPQTAKVPPQVADSDYYWVHLLRPANPNVADADLPKEPKVVVDSFRFPYLVDNGTVSNDPNNPSVTKGTNAIYSVVRSQPYRGGHFIPHADGFSTPHPYGFSEQTRPTRGGVSSLKGIYNVPKGSNTGPAQITGPIYHSINATGSGADDWDHFAFHDRDFQSVAELTLVPACPPGLFTKLFVENGDPVAFGTAAPDPTDPGRRAKTGTLPPDSKNDEPNLAWYYKPPLDKVPQVGITADPNYIAAKSLAGSPPPPTDYCFNGAFVLNSSGVPVRVGVPKIQDPATFPYLAEAFFYTSGTRSGWYKLLEFVEVPSTSLGYIGPVAAGQNADWARRDLRPGLLNLNLIADEECFFGLLDDLRLNNANVTGTQANFVQPGAASTNPVGVTGVPQMVTAIAASGMPTYSITPNSPGFNNGVGAGMKAAFADFLKLRDGGSGVVYSPFSAATPMWGPTDPTKRVSMPSRPFRSLASSDINDTVMRPARLPAFQGLTNSTNPDLAARPNWSPLADLPRVAPRRLFQIPDGDPNGIYGVTGRMDLASETNVNGYVATPGDHTFLYNPAASLFVNTKTSFPDPNGSPAVYNAWGYNGASTTAGDATATPPILARTDHRWHPSFRTEMLSKVMNQTTVRTHQFAVWVTVGFFEVTKEGNPQMAGVYDTTTNVSLAVDQIGQELNAAAGKSVRYRYYFLVDRSRATGFNPSEPGDFRNLIVFQRRIE